MQTNANLEFRKIKSLNFLYEVNENGTIFRNVKSKKQLKIKLDYHHSNVGYYVTFVHLGGRGPNRRIVRVMIHRVVAECWLGDIPDGMEVDHIDRDSHNNDYRNLRFVTKSEQMKNRDHTNIARIGSQNLQEAREKRMKPVLLVAGDGGIKFHSYAGAARYISSQYDDTTFERIRSKLKNGRHHIYDYDVIFLNAETIHDGSTEQEIVHKKVI